MKNFVAISILFGMDKDTPYFDCERFLQRKGWSRKELGSRLDFKESTVGNWCSGVSTPNYATICRLIGDGATAKELFGSELGSVLMANSSASEVFGMQGMFSSSEFIEGVANAIADLKAKGKLGR